MIVSSCAILLRDVHARNPCASVAAFSGSEELELDVQRVERVSDFVRDSASIVSALGARFEWSPRCFSGLGVSQDHGVADDSCSAARLFRRRLFRRSGARMEEAVLRKDPGVARHGFSAAAMAFQSRPRSCWERRSAPSPGSRSMAPKNPQRGWEDT